MLRKIFNEIRGKSGIAVATKALRKAVIKGDVRAIENSLARGALVDARDVNGLTPLYFAAWHGHYDAAELLLKAGANADAGPIGNQEGTALTEAAHSGDTRMIELLVSYGAAVDARTSERSVVHTAVWSNQKEAATRLAELGADVNARCIYNRTPLQDAATFSMRDIALMLARHGADATVQTGLGKDLRTHFLNAGWNDVVAAIDEAQAKKDAVRKAQEDAVAAAKAARDRAIGNVPVLQKDAKVGKPLKLRPRL